MPRGPDSLSAPGSPSPLGTLETERSELDLPPEEFPSDDADPLLLVERVGRVNRLEYRFCRSDNEEPPRVKLEPELFGRDELGERLDRFETEPDVEDLEVGELTDEDLPADEVVPLLLVEGVGRANRLGNRFCRSDNEEPPREKPEPELVGRDELDERLDRFETEPDFEDLEDGELTDEDLPAEVDPLEEDVLLLRLVVGVGVETRLGKRF